MFVDRLLYPIQTLGPGNRAVVWLQGCSHHCYCCANPELWQTQPENWVDARAFAQTALQQLRHNPVDGWTITGGDPMEQADELMAFLQELRPYTKDVLVYTGYTLQQLRMELGEEKLDAFHSLIDVLIDGPYIHEQNDNQVPLRGSTNQIVHYWNEAMKARYETYMQTHGRQIQNVFMRSSMISVGIHNREE